MKVSCFIVTCNRGNQVKLSLNQNIKNNDGEPPWDELIWVDNGSQEPMAVLAATYMPDALLMLKTNLGVSKGFNRGKALCTGDWILCLGDRNILPPGAYKALVSVASSDEVDAICCYDCDWNSKAERTLPGEVRSIAGVSCGPAIAFDTILFRRSLLSTAGYYREDLGMYGWNDVEWANRLKIRNLRTFVLTDYVVERMPDLANYAMPETDTSYREWRDREVADPKKKEVLKTAEEQGYPYYNPFS